MEEIQKDVQGLRPFRVLVDEAPHMVFVFSDDLKCRVLYANAATSTCLHVSVLSLLGRCAFRMRIVYEP